MRKENAWNVQDGKWYPLREKPSCSAAGGDNAKWIINTILMINTITIMIRINKLSFRNNNNKAGV